MRQTPKQYLNSYTNQNAQGVVLIITLVLLVMLSTLAYTLTSRVTAYRHRKQYIIDYAKAGYACTSSLKYAFATLEDLDPQIINRKDEPDFSDLFSLSETEYKEFLSRWAEKNNFANIDRSGRDDIFDDAENNNDVKEFDGNDSDNFEDTNDFNYIRAIRGPYGPPWPLATEVVEFEIGSAKVTIEIEDENAKYPLGWMLLGDVKIKSEATAGFKTFCEWMSLTDDEVDSLIQQLTDVAQLKPFKLDFKPIIKTIREPVTVSRSTRSRRRTRATSRTRVRRKTVSVSDQIAKQNADFAKLFHSSLIDTELLARPIINSETRNESALKYISTWASTKVNINSAPRHVLEAAFTFGGDADNIADEIIKRRRIKPFKDIEDLRKSLFRYSDSISKCEKYITTTSTFFTVKVTAISGTAKTSAVAAITKNGKTVKRVAVISG